MRVTMKRKRISLSNALFIISDSRTMIATNASCVWILAISVPKMTESVAVCYSHIYL